MKKTIALSGGFDPVHMGHIDMIKEASRLGDVIIILNSDAWLEDKKGYVFMPFVERAYIMKNLKGVSQITSVEDTDRTVCEALERMKPDYFGNGGDRTKQNTPEMEVCQQFGIDMVWNLGGGKAQNSSGLVERCYQNIKRLRKE
tara:strand:- start:115 stop:546 length:432 start_codon:yes stop_codon:yes gene_type:complete